MIHIFIVNPKIGKHNFAKHLREKLNTIPELEYYVFSTNSVGHEKELAGTIQHIFAGERLRIYVCGGSGTMHNVLNGLGRLGDVEIAMLPTGGNAFLNIFGDKRKEFESLESLINGKAYPIDYIKANNIVALNAFSLGIDTELIRMSGQIKELGSLIKPAPYLIGLIYSGVISKNHRYRIEIGDSVFEDYSTEVFFGNGGYLGGNLKFASESDITDGLATYGVYCDRTGLARLGMIRNVAAGHFDKPGMLAGCGKSRCMKISRTDGGMVTANLDGEVYEAQSFEVEVMKKGINFVFPEGVEP